MGGNTLRRVVTGETGEGRSRIVEDARMEARNAVGIELFRVWGTAALPIALPTEGGYPAKDENGNDMVHVSLGILPPRTLIQPDAHPKTPDATDSIAFDSSGIHKTESVDVAFVMEGEVVMCVPDEPETILKAGDCVVQNGALHSWENRTDSPAKMLWLWVKAKR
jgi:mannose-6-phosphate isomerase-like protein (cupin superfamily)